MSRTVREIVNPELFKLRATDSAAEALGYLMALGIGGAPVLDEAGKPLGMAGLRELVAGGSRARLSDCMTPAITIPADATIEQAGLQLSEARCHALVAVDADGTVVGVVSAVDLVRALVGLPPAHPETFPHLDRKTGLLWSEETPLLEEYAGQVPSGPGLLMLMVGGKNVPETPVWVEAVANLRARVDDLLGLPQSDLRLRALLERERHNLRFRVAAVPDAGERQAVLRRLLAELEGWRRPGRPPNH